MGWLDFLKTAAPQQRQPDEFDALSAVAKFASIKVCSHAFYQKHHTVIDRAVEFVTALRSQNRRLGIELTNTGVTCEKTAAALRKLLPELELTPATVENIGSTVAELMPQFAPLLSDGSRPEYIEECRWIVEAVAIDPSSSESSK